MDSKETLGIDEELETEEIITATVGDQTVITSIEEKQTNVVDKEQEEETIENMKEASEKAL